MALHTVLLCFISWSSVLHEGLGLPVIGLSEVTDSRPGHRVRTKRCSCNNQLDSECHYFCHLDIIWVNTPSKTAVYGLGSPLVRRHRSAIRCLCANSADQTCYSFCVNSSEKAAGMKKSQFEPVQDKPETRTSDLQSVRLGVAPAVVAAGTENRACADILTFLRNMIRASVMKRASVPTQTDSRVLILGYS